MHHRLKAQSKSQERPAILIRKGVFKDNMDGCCCIITCRMWANKSFDLQRFSLSLDGISVVAQQRHAERVLSAGCALSVWCWAEVSGVQIAFVLPSKVN
jgi:hypothetical protein